MEHHKNQGHILDQKNQTNDYQDMAPVTKSALSGICNQLETHFPYVHDAQKSTIVSHALQGQNQCFGVPTHQKLPSMRVNLLEVQESYRPLPCHDDLLFIAQLFTGTDCLMHLAELTWPDKISLHD